MSNFIDLTLETGIPVAVNRDLVVSVSPLGGDPLRGTAVSFGFSAGDKFAARTIKVAEPYAEVLKRFRKVR